LQPFGASNKRIFLPGRTQKNMLARLHLKILIDVAFIIAQEKQSLPEKKYKAVFYNA